MNTLKNLESACSEARKTLEKKGYIVDNLEIFVNVNGKLAILFRQNESEGYSVLTIDVNNGFKVEVKE